MGNRQPETEIMRFRLPLAVNKANKLRQPAKLKLPHPNANKRKLPCERRPPAFTMRPFSTAQKGKP